MEDFTPIEKEIIKSLKKEITSREDAERGLAYINNETDIKTLNLYVMDCLRAAQTRRFDLGGLGVELEKKDGVVTRGTGRNVTTNRQRTDKHLDGYLTLYAAKKALGNRDMFDNLVRSL